MTIITIGGVKGGSGKTTVAINFTVKLSQAHKVLLVDADEQESATDFVNWRAETKKKDGGVGFTSIQLSGEDLRRQVLQLRKKYEYIIIDAGGRDTTSQRAAISVSNLFLTPFLPRSIDIWTLEKVVKMLTEMSAINPELIMLTFLNKADHIGTNNRDTFKILKKADYADLKLEVLESALYERIVFAYAASQGLGVLESPKVDRKAEAEFLSLYKEVLSKLKQR